LRIAGTEGPDFSVGQHEHVFIRATRFSAPFEVDDPYEKAVVSICIRSEGDGAAGFPHRICKLPVAEFAVGDVYLAGNDRRDAGSRAIDMKLQIAVARRANVLIDVADESRQRIGPPRIGRNVNVLARQRSDGKRGRRVWVIAVDVAVDFERIVFDLAGDSLQQDALFRKQEMAVPVF
jgi:hypothetical protein